MRTPTHIYTSYIHIPYTYIFISDIAINIWEKVETIYNLIFKNNKKNKNRIYIGVR